MNAQQDLLQGEITGLIRQTAFEVHRYFGRGFLEKVYENALANRLNKKGLCAEQQRGIEVRDEDGTIVGEYCADIAVNDVVMVELKAVSRLVPEHVAQVLNYLKATGFQVGMLINFGASKLEVRRFVSPRTKRGSQPI